MQVNRIGWYQYGDLEIECTEVEDGGSIYGYVFRLNGGAYLDFQEFMEDIGGCCPALADYLFAIGMSQFLEDVLQWDPSDSRTRDSFYSFEANELNRTNGWD